MTDLLDFSTKLKSVLQHLPDLLSYEQDAAARAANIERLKGDEARVIESLKTRAVSDAQGEIDAKHAQADANIRKKEAEAQERLDQVDAELRMKRKLIEQADGELERKNAQLAEVNRVLNSVATRYASAG